MAVPQRSIEQQVCVCVLKKIGGHIADEQSRFSPVTCLSNQHKGFMVHGYNESTRPRKLILQASVSPPDPPTLL